MTEQGNNMAGLVKRMFSGQMGVSEIIQQFDNHPVESLSSQDLADAVGGVITSARYRINTSTYNKPIVAPAGTGGDGTSTVNITTMAGFVMAASGDCIVPLYGNGKATGKFGKMDALQALGIPIELEEEQVRTLLRAVGIAPVFARYVYPGAGGNVAQARREVGKPTFFNLAMPLAAPIIGEVRLLQGVADESKMQPMGDILSARRTAKALLVHNRSQGQNGMDEMSFGLNRIDVISNNGRRLHRKSYLIDTAQFGITSAPLSFLQANTPEEFINLFEHVLDHTYSPSTNQQRAQIDAIRRVVAMNAACGFFVAQQGVENFEHEFPKLYKKALQIIETGQAHDKLQELRLAARRIT